MYIVKVLKRKDASSLIVAICLGMQLQQFINITYGLSARISSIGTMDIGGGYGGISGIGWRNEYLNPVVSFVLQVVVLELLIRLFVWIHPMLVSKKR